MRIWSWWGLEGERSGSRFTEAATRASRASCFPSTSATACSLSSPLQSPAFSLTIAVIASSTSSSTPHNTFTKSPPHRSVFFEPLRSSSDILPSRSCVLSASLAMRSHRPITPPTTSRNRDGDRRPCRPRHGTASTQRTTPRQRSVVGSNSTPVRARSPCCSSRKVEALRRQKRPCSTRPVN